MLEKIDFERLKLAIMNFFVWGLGFLAQRQYKRGLIWFFSYALILFGIFYGFIGYGAITYLFSPFGRLIVIGLVMVSVSLAFETYFIQDPVQTYD